MTASVQTRTAAYAPGSFAESRLAIVLLALLCALPVVFPPVLPLVDLGGHVGRYTVQLDGGQSALPAQWYTFEWHLVPNLGVDLLVQAFGPLLGIETTVRLAVVATAFLTAAGILQMSRQLHGRVTAGAILALPVIYNYAFWFGFINFTLSLALALCALVLWLRMEAAAGWKRWLVFAAIACFLWVCHLVGWAVFCIAAGSCELVRRLQERGPVLQVLRPTSLALSCLLLPLAAGWLLGPESSERGVTEGWFLWSFKLRGLAAALRDEWFAFDILSVALLLGFIMWSWSAKSHRLHRGMLLATVLVASAAVALPFQTLGSQHADLRLIPVALILALLTARPAPQFRGRAMATLMVAALAFAGLRLASNGVSAWETGALADRDMRVLSSLPAGANLLSFRARRCDWDAVWPIDSRTHLAGYALARRKAFANDQWQIPGAQLIRVHNDSLAPYQTDPAQTDYEAPCGNEPGLPAKAPDLPAAASHLWVIWDNAPQALTGWSVKARSGNSVLYERAGDQSLGRRVGA